MRPARTILIMQLSNSRGRKSDSEAGRDKTVWRTGLLLCAGKIFGQGADLSKTERKDCVDVADGSKYNKG